MARHDPALCLTCGGPAALCARSDACLGTAYPNLRPPQPNADVLRRSESAARGVFWLKAAVTVLAWLPLLVVVRGLDTPGAPLLVFLGVPYAVGVAWATYAGWRVRNVGTSSMPWLP